MYSIEHLYTHRCIETILMGGISPNMFHIFVVGGRYPTDMSCHQDSMSKIRLLTLASMARGQLGNRTSGFRAWKGFIRKCNVEVDEML